MKKLITLITLLIMLPFVYPYTEETFTNTISVKFANYTANITTEENSHVYDCMSNTTHSFTFSLKRNLSANEEIINDFEDSIDEAIDKLKDQSTSVSSTCEAIKSQYQDFSSYFKLYTDCNADYKVCANNLANKELQVVELTPFENQYTTCKSNLDNIQINYNSCVNEAIPSMQMNLTQMQQDYDKVKKSRVFFFFVGLGIALAFMAYKNARMTPTTQREEIGR